ncbi:hypothetical protein KC317_g16857, partial [Hortaea werneckii]
MADTPGSEQSRREAQIVDRHLPDGYTAAPEAVDYDSHDTAEPDHQANGEQQESSLRLQGGDIHRDIFKIKARAAAPKRANTFSAAHQKPKVPITPEGDD